MAKTLLDLMYEADAIEIDGTFCRYFHLELEECESDEDIILHVEFEADYNIHEHFFARGELRYAVPQEDGSWYVANTCVGTYVTPCKVEILK